ncbi:MAG TPA: hypothetical protein VJY35_09475, partial [Candidatus Eisenbacteria bacterium]|nr:hypothetical protein [Candidatus Eisenbacteria bacterium]
QRFWPGEPARRATAVSAVAGAVALVVLVRILERVRAAPGTAVAGVILVGAGVTFRWASIYPEVYAIAVVFFLLALERTLAAAREPTTGRVFAATALFSLAVTGHLLFAPAAAVIGIYLVMQVAREAPAPGRPLVAMMLGLVVGFVPYLYTVWADMAGLPMNYLRLVVDPASGMFGLTPQRFDAPWERVGWLLNGAETHPTDLRLKVLAANAVDAIAHEFLFDAGPVALILAPIGALTLARSMPVISLILMLVAATSWLLTTVVAHSHMWLTFMIPATLVIGIFGALGAARLAAAIAARPGASAILAVVIAIAAVLIPHALRVTAAWDPIGPRHWHHEVEGGPALAGILPRLDQAWESRRTGERALALIPRGALVIGRWRELMTLYYLRDVEGRRTDLTFDPVYRGHEPRYARWQAALDLREHPFVLLGRSPEIAPYLGALDSVTVRPGLKLYIQREPMRGLPSR